jgi:uncharacterized membrane protein YjgN (DUF898 family)
MHASVEYRPAGSLAKLLLKNALLNLVTLTFYRFWAKTAVRRYFWQAVRIDGEPLEYTGLGRELFIGFLIVLAVLAPLTLLWSAVQTLLAGDPVATGFAQTVYFLALFVLIQAATFRARGYRLSRTCWRGIRAGQDGSTWRYIGLSLLWGFVTLITAGIGYPGLRLATQRYRTANTRFGDRHMSIDARLTPLFIRWLVVLAPLILFYLAVLGLIAVSGVRSAEDARAVGAALGTHWQLLLLVVALVMALPFLWAWYRVAEFRYLAAHTRLGDIAFRSKARSRSVIARVIWFVLAAIGATIFAGLLIVWWAPIVVGFGVGSPAVAGGILGGVIGVVLFVFGYRFLWTTIVTAGLVHHLSATLEIAGLDSVRTIAQSATAGQKFGEGLADSFEIAG